MVSVIPATFDPGSVHASTSTIRSDASNRLDAASSSISNQPSRDPLSDSDAMTRHEVGRDNLPANLSLTDTHVFGSRHGQRIPGRLLPQPQRLRGRWRISTNAEFGIQNPFAPECPDLTPDRDRRQRRRQPIPDSARPATAPASSIARTPSRSETRSRSPGETIRFASVASSGAINSTATCRKRGTARHNFEAGRLPDGGLQRSGRQKPGAADLDSRPELRRDRAGLPDDGLELVRRRDWKVTSKLTINLGIRHEYFGFPSEENGLFTVFDYPAALATGQSRTGSSFRRTSTGSFPRRGRAQTSGSPTARISCRRPQQLHAAYRLRVVAVREATVVLAAGTASSSSASRRLRQFAAAVAAVLPRVAARRSGRLEYHSCRHPDSSRFPIHDHGRLRRRRAAARGVEQSRHEFEAFETQMVSPDPRHSVHAAMEPQRPVGVQAELAVGDRLRRQQGAANCCRLANQNQPLDIDAVGGFLARPGVPGGGFIGNYYDIVG